MAGQANGRRMSEVERAVAGLGAVVEVRTKAHDRDIDELKAQVRDLGQRLQHSRDQSAAVT